MITGKLTELAATAGEKIHYALALVPAAKAMSQSQLAQRTRHGLSQFASSDGSGAPEAQAGTAEQQTAEAQLSMARTASGLSHDHLDQIRISQKAAQSELDEADAALESLRAELGKVMPNL
ncbi:MAG: hypothetical protein ACK5JT_22550 [Hyphomicrobiaceae bacterium]